MNAEYRIGEVVDITIAGARVIDSYLHVDETTIPRTVKRCLTYHTPDGTGGTIVVDAASVTVTRVPPADAS